MQVDCSRERAADILLGRVTPDLEAFASVPPYLRARAARRAAVRCLAEQTRLSSLEVGALIRAATADGDVQVRATAVTALGRLLPPGLAAPVLVACSADRDEPVRTAALAALSRVESEEPRVVPLSRPAAPARPAKVPRFIGH